jgi:hypothetical protein
VEEQLKKMLKKIIYSRRKSAKGFYDDEKDGAAESEYVD